MNKNRNNTLIKSKKEFNKSSFLFYHQNNSVKNCFTFSCNTHFDFYKTLNLIAQRLHMLRIPPFSLLTSSYLWHTDKSI